MKRLIAAAALAAGFLSAGPVQAADCWFDHLHLCRGCSESMTAKMRRFHRSEKLRWCTFRLGSSRNVYERIVVLKGFDLGELRTGSYALRFSPLKTGRSTVVYELHARAGDSGTPYVSRVEMKIDVVEGPF